MQQQQQLSGVKAVIDVFCIGLRSHFPRKEGNSHALAFNRCKRMQIGKLARAHPLTKENDMNGKEEEKKNHPKMN